MTTVGRIAGVSQVTVSRALSDPSKVSADTLRRIREAIEVTGFVPNAVAGALASRRTSLVTALVPSVTNIVYSSFIAPFAERLREHGYQILLSETGFDLEEEEALVAAHLSKQPDAMLLTGVHHTARTRRMLLGYEIPTVEVWDITDTPIDLCVGFDHAAASADAADFVADCGHRRAAVVSADDRRALRRQKAFIDRLARRGITDVAVFDVGGPASIGDGRLALATIIDESKFTEGAIFCSSDLLAHGVVIEAHARGLPIPETLSVIGFGDQDFASELDPPLTTLRVDRERLGRCAADALIARMSGHEVAESVLDLGHELMRRGSA